MSRYADIDKSTCAELPKAILEALALDDNTGPRLFGAVEWQQVESRYAAGIAELSTECGDDESNTFCLPAPNRPKQAAVVVSILGALAVSIAIFVGMSRETRVVATLVSSTRTAPATVKPGDVPSLTVSHMESRL